MRRPSLSLRAHVRDGRHVASLQPAAFGIHDFDRAWPRLQRHRSNARHRCWSVCGREGRCWAGRRRSVSLRTRWLTIGKRMVLSLSLSLFFQNIEPVHHRDWDQVQLDAMRSFTRITRSRRICSGCMSLGRCAEPLSARLAPLVPPHPRQPIPRAIAFNPVQTAGAVDPRLFGETSLAALLPGSQLPCRVCAPALARSKSCQVACLEAPVRTRALATFVLCF